jgi:excisionase family DNA binding protein
LLLRQGIAMAGRFLSLEEAAQKLGLSVDDVHRLVDRKQVYPIRDGGGLKFKADDLEQYLRDQQEAAGTHDDLSAQPAETERSNVAPLELDVAADDSLTLDVEAMIELEPASAVEVEAAAVEEPLSAIDVVNVPVEVMTSEHTSNVELMLDLDGTSPSAVDATPAPRPVANSPTSPADSVVMLEPDDAGSDALVLAEGSHGDHVLDAGSGRISLDRDDLELDSIIAASAASLVAADASPDDGTLAIDLGEPILGGPSGSKSHQEASSGLVIGSDLDLGIGSNGPSGRVGSALSDVLDSGVLIEEKAVELEGIQTWDEVDLGIENDDEGSLSIGGEQGSDDLGGSLGGDFDNDQFDLGSADDSGSVIMPGDASEASDMFSAGMDSSGFSGHTFGDAADLSGSLGIPGEMSMDVRFSTWQICGLICCSLILLIGGLITFDLVRTIGTSQATVLANPLLDAFAETFGWR